ncbi:hypothetical protein [Gardnerella vaginalis]|uniref:hypothetical protein n=1 Tax=Gardnerella vaginalis TaxID=2702 RepID=UPI0020C5E549|nr:hypothetical protein [Gardnerella vaginalis]
MNKTTKIILTSTMMGIATAACAVCMSQTAYASNAIASSVNGTNVESANSSTKTNTPPPPHTDSTNQHNLKNDKSTNHNNTTSEDRDYDTNTVQTTVDSKGVTTDKDVQQNTSHADSTSNELASGTATDKNGTQVKWQVTDNSSNIKATDAAKMSEYGKQLNYDSNNNKLIATMSNLPFKNEAANVVARKYNEITLKVTNNNETTPTIISNIKETPWFYKSQYLKNILDEIDKTTIGSYNFTRYNQEQKVGGKHLSGLKYNFSARKVEGTPIITDWQEGETSRIIPVYMATTHTGKDSDYITLGILQNITVNKPKPPVVSPTPQPKPPESATNVLASGTATDSNDKQVQWQVLNNDKNPDTEQMTRYSKYLSYNPDKNELITTVNAAPFTEKDANISARKFSNITLKITKDGKTTEENIKETPWFFKDQNSQKMWDSINQTTIGTYSFAKHNLEQKVGGVGLKGLSYDFLNKNFDGAPTIAWKNGEISREIPVYIATIHKGKDGSDYMTVGEFKKFKAYKNRNDIFEGKPGTNPLTKQQYKFSDLGDNNVSRTVTAMYANGPIYLKPGETKTVPLKFYLVDENRKPIKDITDEFMKVLNPEPKEVEIKKVLFTRNRQTSLMDMNVSYVLHTDYSITFTANKDAQVGDSYNTDGSKLDNLPMVLNPAETPKYTYEPGITLHEKSNAKHVAFINAFFDVIQPDPKPAPKPEPPKPEPPKPEPPKPEPPKPEPPKPEPPKPEPTPVPTTKSEPIPVPIIPALEQMPMPVTELEPEPEPTQEETVEEAPTLQTHEPLARAGSTTSTIAGTGLAFLLSSFGAFSLKRTRIGKHSK